MQNVYQMREANDHQCGFWIMRRGWSRTAAKVVEFVGFEDGEPLSGQPPYFENPGVLAEFYSWDDFGRGSFESFSEVSCPGTYSYLLIEEPTWAHIVSPGVEWPS